MAYRSNNYSFVIDSSFQPLTMQEMLMPLAAYKDAYDKTEETYIDLSNKADKFKYLSETLPEGSQARNIYEGYANNLKAQADNLISNDFNLASSRRALTDLRRRYAGEIGRLETADAARKAQIAEQQKLYLQDPTRMFSREAAMSTIDDYLDNPEVGYKSYSGALLAQQVGTMASAIGKSLRDSLKTGRLDGFTKTWIEQHGFDPGDVAAAIADPSSDRHGILSAIVHQAVDNSGMREWADDATLRNAYGWASQGLWNAIGQSQVHTYTDEAAKLAAQEASRMRTAEYAARLQQQQLQQQQRVNHAMLIPRALRSQREMTTMRDNLAKYKQLGYIAQDKDGNYVVTAKGMSAYKTPVDADELIPGFMDPTEKGVAQRGAASSTTDSAFKRFLDSENGGVGLIKDGVFNNQVANSIITDFANRTAEDSYDTYHSTEYVRQLDDAYAKEVKRQVMSEPEVLKSVDFNGKDGFTGKSIDKSELEKFIPTRINYSRFGNTITWVNDKGEMKRTNAPGAVNERVSSTVQQAMNNAAMISAVLREGKLPKSDIYGNPIIKDGVVQFSDIPLTKEMADAYYNDWQNEMDIVSSIGSMYVTPSTTKNLEYKPYEFGAGMQGMFDYDDYEEE